MLKHKARHKKDSFGVQLLFYFNQLLMFPSARLSWQREFCQKLGSTNQAMHVG